MSKRAVPYAQINGDGWVWSISARAPTLISLVRHGHVQNPRNVFYGRSLDFPLSEEGYRQSRAAAKALCEKPFTAIFSSPQHRSCQTAASILAPHYGMSVQISPLLNEVYTPYDNYPIAAIIARYWDVYTDSDSQYEQPIDVLSRAQQFTMEVRQQHAGQHIVAVTHGDVITFLMLWALGIPITAKNKQPLRHLGLSKDYPAPASISTFVYQTPDRDEVPKLEYLQPY